MLRTYDGSKYSTTASDAFFDAAATTAFLARPFVDFAVSVRRFRFLINIDVAALGKLPDGHQVKSSERFSAHLQRRPDESAGGSAEGSDGDHQNEPNDSWRTSDLWPSTIEPEVALNPHRDDPGPLCVVRVREGCLRRIG